MGRICWARGSLPWQVRRIVRGAIMILPVEVEEVVRFSSYPLYCATRQRRVSPHASSVFTSKRKREKARREGEREEKGET